MEPSLMMRRRLNRWRGTAKDAVSHDSDDHDDDDDDYDDYDDHVDDDHHCHDDETETEPLEGDSEGCSESSSS